MLLPITSAVYVSGNLMSNDKILLDIGTGYFAEVCVNRMCFARQAKRRIC